MTKVIATEKLKEKISAPLPAEASVRTGAETAADKVAFYLIDVLSPSSFEARHN